MGKILDYLLIIGPVLAVLLGFVFAFASPSSRLFARRPLPMALAVVIPVLIATAGTWRMQNVEDDRAVVLAVIGLGAAGCVLGFAIAFGLGLLLQAISRSLAGRGTGGSFRSTGFSHSSGGLTRRKGLPPGPRIKQGK